MNVRLIIGEDSVYEIDEQCMQEKNERKSREKKPADQYEVKKSRKENDIDRRQNRPGRGSK